MFCSFRADAEEAEFSGRTVPGYSTLSADIPLRHSSLFRRNFRCNQKFFILFYQRFAPQKQVLIVLRSARTGLVRNEEFAEEAEDFPEELCQLIRRMADMIALCG